MKVLHSTIGFLPAVAWGGPVQVVYQDALELQRRGHQVTVCASNRLDKDRYVERGLFERNVHGIRVVYLDTRLQRNWPGTVGPTWLSLPSIRRIMHEVGQADVVHAHGTRNMIVMVTALAARIHGKPLVLQPHGTLPHVVSSIWLKRLFDGVFMGWLLSSAHAIIALQETEERQIAKSGGAADRVHRVPNGLNTDGYRAEDYRGRFRAKLRIPSQTTIILFLGRLNRKKGADLLLEAFARLPESMRSSAQLVVAGPDDGELAELRKITARLGLNDQVLFPGLLAGDDVLAAYADADLFVLPCRGDTFPMTILEACRAGKPMVVTETCEISDLLAGEAGEVVPVEPAGLAEGMQRILSDRCLYERYGSGTQRLMESEFSISAVVDRLEVIYHSVIGAASGA